MTTPDEGARAYSDRLTKVEAAKLLGISRASLYVLIAEKRIAHYKPHHGTVQLYRSDIEEYLRSVRVEVVQPEGATSRRSRRPATPQVVERARQVALRLLKRSE